MMNDEFIKKYQDAQISSLNLPWTAGRESQFAGPDFILHYFVVRDCLGRNVMRTTGPLAELQTQVIASAVNVALLEKTPPESK